MAVTSPPVPSERERRQRAARLVAEGRMPTFADLLAAIHEAALEIREERESRRRAAPRAASPRARA